MNGTVASSDSTTHFQSTSKDAYYEDLEVWDTCK
jgi:hypothetical protein